jgi:hypothetical protein
MQRINDMALIEIALGGNIHDHCVFPVDHGDGLGRRQFLEALIFALDFGEQPEQEYSRKSTCKVGMVAGKLHYLLCFHGVLYIGTARLRYGFHYVIIARLAIPGTAAFLKGQPLWKTTSLDVAVNLIWWQLRWIARP